MLDNMKPTERFADGDAFDQIASRCRAAQPKIQKWISNAEENEDADTIGELVFLFSLGIAKKIVSFCLSDKLLLMNDLINNVLDRYKSFKKGDRSANAEINPAFAKNGTKGKTASKAAAAPNLIDFDEPAEETSNGNGGASSNPMDDAFGLGGLTIGGSSSSTVPVHSGNTSNGAGLLDGLDFGSSSAAPQQQSTFYQQYQSTSSSGAVQQPTVSWGNLSSQPGQRSSSPMNTNTFAQNHSLARTQSPSSPLSPGNRTSLATNQTSLRPSTPGAINLGMMGAVPPSSPLGQPQNQQAPQQQQQQQQNSGQPAKLKDPFDDLLNF